MNFWDVLGDSSVLRFELGFIGESDLGDPTAHVKLDVGAELTLNEALVTSSNRANSGDDTVVLDCGFEISIGKETNVVSSAPMVGMRDAGGLTRR